VSARILFLDVGGTLLNERRPRHELYAACAAAHGLAVDPERMRRLMSNAHRALPLYVDGGYRYTDAWFRRFIEQIFCTELGLPEDQLAAVQEQLFAVFEDPATFELARGADELLALLARRDMRVGILSNWSARLPVLLGRLGLAGRFDPVVCSALVGCEKPDPRIFELALRLAGVSADQAIHVGDREDNDGAAAQVGIHTILVGSASNRAPRPPRSGSGERIVRLDDLEALCAYIHALR